MTILAIISFLLVLAGVVLLRHKFAPKMELKWTDIAIALVPIVIWLLFSGKIKSMHVGDLGVDTMFAEAAAAKVEAQVREIDTQAAQKIEGLQKQIVMAPKPTKKQETAKKAVEARITAAKAEADAKKKEANANMPKAIFPLKNPGLFSMAAAFLIGILVSLLAPEKEASDKFAGEKLREYVGIGAE